MQFLKKVWEKYLDTFGIPEVLMGILVVFAIGVKVGTKVPLLLKGAARLLSGLASVAYLLTAVFKIVSALLEAMRERNA